jgi:hypothetical protein
MIRAVRNGLGEHVDRVYYSLLRATVAWLVPAAVRFDEQDPLLCGRVDGFDPARRGR